MGRDKCIFTSDLNIGFVFNDIPIKHIRRLDMIRMHLSRPMTPLPRIFFTTSGTMDIKLRTYEFKRNLTVTLTNETIVKTDLYFSSNKFEINTRENPQITFVRKVGILQRAKPWMKILSPYWGMQTFPWFFWGGTHVVACLKIQPIPLSV